MAEEKKTTAKKTTAKKAVKKPVPKKTTAKKTTAKKGANKTAPKKTVRKKTVTKKKTVRKITATKATPMAATASKKETSRDGSPLTMNDWGAIVDASVKSLKNTWWRMGVVSLLGFVITLLITALIAGGTIFSAGGLAALESEFVNLQFGAPNLGFLWTIGVLLIVLITFLFLISFVVNIALMLTFKNAHHGLSNNPIEVFFVDSWNFFWRYAYMALRVFCFIVWPPLLIGALGILLSLAGLPEELLMTMVIVLVAVAIGLVIWRAVRVIFAYTGLVESAGAVVPTFNNINNLVKGNWWMTFWCLLLFFIPLGVIQNILGADPTPLAGLFGLDELSMTILLVGTGIVSLLLSFFLFTPLSIAFVYLLMLHLSKTKNIKL